MNLSNPFEAGLTYAFGVIMGVALGYLIAHHQFHDCTKSVGYHNTVIWECGNGAYKE